MVNKGLWNYLKSFLKSIVRDTKGPKDFVFIGNNIVCKLFKLEGALGVQLADNQSE